MHQPIQDAKHPRTKNLIGPDPPPPDPIRFGGVATGSFVGFAWQFG